MILDSLANAAKYYPLHPGLKEAFEFLKKNDPAALGYGKHAIQGDEVYAAVSDSTGTGASKAKLESHGKYIDVQVVIAGSDTIGWRSVSSCSQELDFDAAKDCFSFRESPDTWFELIPGNFAIFFPEDAHAPLAGKGPVRKVVIKVKASR